MEASNLQRQGTSLCIQCCHWSTVFQSLDSMHRGNWHLLQYSCLDGSFYLLYPFTSKRITTNFLFFFLHPLQQPLSTVSFDAATVQFNSQLIGDKPYVRNLSGLSKNHLGISFAVWTLWLRIIDSYINRSGNCRQLRRQNSAHCLNKLPMRVGNLIRASASFPKDGLELMISHFSPLENSTKKGSCTQSANSSSSFSFSFLSSWSISYSEQILFFCLCHFLLKFFSIYCSKRTLLPLRNHIRCQYLIRFGQKYLIQSVKSVS